LQEIDIPATFPPAGLEVRWFQIGNQQIHLIRTSEPNPPGPRHVALQNDAKGARSFLNAKGIAIQETVSIPGADRFFIADPDGNRIEIIEWQETPPDREI
jgi:catechol 2,3-dioxygenase-like lactoylglutathione lyase family enzyme